MCQEKSASEQNFESYRELKLRYFSLISNRRMPRGKMRALIGSKAASLETDLILSGENPDNAHKVAFNLSLNYAASIKSKGELEEILPSAIKEWMNSRLKEKFLWDELRQIDYKEIPKKANSVSAISLFSGAMGLDLGFMESGVNIMLGNDIDKDSYNTVISNMPGFNFINDDIDKIEPEDLMKKAGITPGQVDLLIGGPPCQPFSPAGRRAGLNDPRASPLRYFIKAIKELKPAAFVMEEVPGLISSRLKHFPYYDKYKRTPVGDEVRGSAFQAVLEMLNSTGYKFSYKVLNAADYGAPQIRNRVIFIGLKEGEPSFPEPTHSGDGSGEREPWITFWESARKLRYTKDMELAKEDLEYMKYVPPGGNWSVMPQEVVKLAMGSAYESEGGRMGFYRRLPWDEPSPTLVTSPAQKGTFLVHPEFDRFLSIAEYKVLQGFPDSWKISGGMGSKYRLIGNAVPTYLSKAISRHVLKILRGMT